MLDEPISSFVEKTNLLNNAQRADRHNAEAKLAKIKRRKLDIVDTLEDRRYGETPVDRLLDLEAEEKVLKRQMAEAPAATPDIHPNIFGTYAKKVGQLAEALNRSENRDAARRVWRHPRMTKSAGDQRGQKRRQPRSLRCGAWSVVKMVAGTGFDRCRTRFNLRTARCEVASNQV